jgi:hypothetical protein
MRLVRAFILGLAAGYLIFSGKGRELLDKLGARERGRRPLVDTDATDWRPAPTAATSTADRGVSRAAAG